MNKPTSKLFVSALAAAFCLSTACMAAETGSLQSSEAFQSPGVYWVAVPSIVEQLQSIHRLAQSSAPEAWQGLVNALGSQYPLARRKAARGLLDRVPVTPAPEQRRLVTSIQKELNNADPMVQKTLIRVVAQTQVPESQGVLRQFFAGPNHTAQLNAVEALATERPDLLRLVAQASPYADVRKAAETRLVR